MNTKTTKIEEVKTQEGKVGTMLHDVRIKKKLTIEDIAQELRIKTAYLIAIEESDYNNIPKPPYGIGFVRSYASYLGLNSARIVQIFKEENNIKEPKSTQAVTSEDSEQQSEEETYTLNGKYILISLIMFVLVYLLWVFLSNENTIEESDTTASQTEISNEDYSLRVENFITETEEEVNAPSEIEQINIKNESFVETKEPTPSENKTTEKVETKEKSAPSADAITTKQGRVVLKIKKETWVEVKDDNRLWLSKVLQAGSEYVVPDNGNGKTVSFGNTDGVDVIIDGKIVTIVSQNKKTNIKLDAFLGNH